MWTIEENLGLIEHWVVSVVILPTMTTLSSPTHSRSESKNPLYVMTCKVWMVWGKRRRVRSSPVFKVAFSIFRIPSRSKFLFIRRTQGKKEQKQKKTRRLTLTKKAPYTNTCIVNIFLDAEDSDLPSNNITKLSRELAVGHNFVSAAV